MDVNAGLQASRKSKLLSQYAYNPSSNPPALQVVDKSGTTRYYGLRKSTSASNRGMLVPVRISKERYDSTSNAFYNEGKVLRAPSRKAVAKSTRVTIDLHPTIVSTPRPTSTSSSTSQHIDGYKTGKAQKKKKRHTSKPY